MERDSFLSRSSILLVVGFLVGLFLPHILAIPSGETTSLINLIIWMVVVAVSSFYLGRKLGGGISWIIWLASLWGGSFISDIVNIPIIDSFINDPGDIGFMAISVLAGSLVFALLFQAGTSNSNKSSKTSSNIVH